MKKLILLVSSFLLATGSYAQSTYAGIRAGADTWMVQEKGRSIFNSGMNGQNTSFFPTVFLRLETKRHWAWEFSVNNSKTAFKTFDAWDGISCFGGPSRPYTNNTTYNTSHTGLTASLQYDVKQLVGCKHASRLKNYIGLMLSPTISKQLSTGVVTYTDNSSGYSNEYETIGLDLWAAVSNTLSYRLSNDIDITSSVNFRTSAAFLLDGYESFTKRLRYTPDTRFSCQLGIAYKLN